MVQRINVYQAKATLSELLAKVERTGDRIVLCRNGKPIADLVPHKKDSISLKPPHELRGAKFKSDPTEGVSLEDWPAELRP